MMSDQEDRHYVFEAVVRTAVCAYERGGMEAVRRIGIEGMTEEDLHRLATLQLSEIRKLLAAPVVPIVAVAVNSQMDLMWKLAGRRREELVEQEALIRAGACLPLLAAEYGMTGEDYANMRQRLGISSNGRPPLLSDQQEAHLHEIWTAYKNKPSSQRWLALARAGIPLASAWASIQKERAEAAAVIESTEENKQTDPPRGQR